MVLTLIWLVFILFLSIIPVRGLPTGHPIDKIVHFVIYGVTSIILFKVLRKKMSLVKTTVFSIVIASFYGLVIELIQHALPWREFSFLDEASNFIGALVFSGIYAIRDHNRERSKMKVASIDRKGD